jgi:flagellar hook-basal body complex protein FliE
MAVSPIGNIFNAIGFAQPTSAANPAAETGAANGASGAAPAGNDGNAFTNMLDGLQGAHDNADQLAVQAATGNLTDIHNYTIAATEAQIMTELTVAVRDKAVAAFEEIMRMQA